MGPSRILAHVVLSCMSARFAAVLLTGNARRVLLNDDEWRGFRKIAWTRVPAIRLRAGGCQRDICYRALGQSAH